MADRSRADLSAAQIAKLNRPQVTSKSFFKYDECAQVQQAKLHVGYLEQGHEVLSLLHQGCPKLNYKRSTVVGAMELLFDEKAEGWAVDKKHKVSWVTTMSRRILNAARVVSQGEAKSPKATWVKNLP